MAKFIIWQILFFCWLLLGQVVWPRLGDLFVSQNSIEVYVSHSPGWNLVCAYTPLVHVVKLKCFAQLPVDYLSHSIVSSLILFLH